MVECVVFYTTQGTSEVNIKHTFFDTVHEAYKWIEKAKYYWDFDIFIHMEGKIIEQM